MELLRSDATLQPLIETIKLSPLEPKYDAFTALHHSIVSQQLSTKSAAAILRRFEEQIPHPCTAKSILSVSEQSFRSIGLSSRKASYCHNIARHWQQNTIFWQQIEKHSDEKIIDELIKIKGVGVWTVQMLLMFTLKREDIFPIGDLAIRDSMGKLYNIDVSNKKNWPKLERIAKKWSPYRSVASRYLWAYRNSKK
jgi:DNA-3-methyladenine glycosylase II